MNEFSQQLASVQQRMDVDISNILPDYVGSAAVLSDAMRYAALGGGKRLRPFLVIQSAQVLGYSDDVIWKVACALECVHVYSLIHDDLPCMDDDDLRHGKPTVHKAFDEAIAVLTGDGLLTLAFEILSTLEIDADIKLDLISGLSRAAGPAGMIGGQVLDIRAQDSQASEESITKLQSQKTGALIAYATYAGACLAGASENQHEILKNYANDLGLLFQITDDILDEIGDAARLGKAVRKDKNLGKTTFASILGLDGAKKKAAELAGRAKGHLEPLGKRAQILADTVDYVLVREH